MIHHLRRMLYTELIGSPKFGNVLFFVQLIHWPTITENQLYNNPNIAYLETMVIQLLAALILFQWRHLRVHVAGGGVRFGRGSSAAAVAVASRRREAAQAVEEGFHVGDVRQHGALQQEDNLHLAGSGRGSALELDHQS